MDDFEQINLERREAQRLLLTQRRLLIVALVLIIAFLLLQVVMVFSDLLRILAVSVFVCYMIVGLVDRLEKPFRSRINSVLAVYGIGGSIVVVGVILLIPAIVHQVTSLITTTYEGLPVFVEWLTHSMAPLENKLNILNFEVRPSELLMNTVSSLPKPDGQVVFSQVSGVAMGTMTWMFYGLSILILSFYFLLDGSRMANSMVGLFPERYSVGLREFVSDSNTSLQDFFRGQIVLGLLFGGFMTLVYIGLGVHYALALGLLLGVWEIVPVVGPVLGFVPAVVAVALEGMDMIPETIPGGRLAQILILILVFNAFQWIKDNVIAPRYIGDVIGLHPVLIFIAIMVGARLDGMLGIIVSLPVACVLNVMFKQLRKSRHRAEEGVSIASAYDEAHPRKSEEIEGASAGLMRTSEHVERKDEALRVDSPVSDQTERELGSEDASGESSDEDRAK